MFLKYLHITKTGQTLRKIDFKKGVNLIVDTTHESKTQESGNNVGKTTVLRLIDYCLGNGGNDIYKGAEFKNTDMNVKQFLIDNDVEISVCLTSSLQNNKSKEIILKRNFLQRKEKIASINGENFPNLAKDYNPKLNELIFGIKSGKPTFRQIASRFVRNDPLKMNNILKYLPVTKDTVYETIFLYMFGVKDKTELLSKKQIVSEQLKSEKKYLTNISKDWPSTTIEQLLNALQNDIEDLNTKKQEFNVSPKYQEEFEKLKFIKEKINTITSKLAEKQLRLTLIQENVSDLKENISNVDNEALKTLYAETGSFIPDLQKKFEDAVDFHNSLIQNKLKFISKNIPVLKEEIKKFKSTLNSELLKEEEIGKKLLNTGSLADYDLLVSELNIKFEKKGQLDERLEQIKKSEKSITENAKILFEINIEIEKSEPILEKNITLFNRFFTYYSKELYNEKFVLSHFIDKKIYKLRIDDAEKNTGDGKKKVQIAAFDLAYIAFTKEIGMKSFSFEMHDRIESIHSHQLSTLFELVNSDKFDGQYIVSVLKDKFDTPKLKKYLEDNKVLELSQEDKLFRIKNR